MMRWLGEVTGFVASSVGLSESQIRAHRQQTHERDTWQRDVDHLRRVLEHLETSYSAHKGDFALGRYEELKRMIKEAIDGCEAVVREQKSRPALCEIRGRRGLKGKTTNEFKSTASGLSSDQQLYASMTKEEYEDDVARMRRQVLQLKQDFRQLRDRFKRLETDYEQSKSVNPAQRYMDLKELIKNVVAKN